MKTNSPVIKPGGKPGWMLNIAFVLFMIFTYSMVALITMRPDGQERIGHLPLFNMTGVIIGVVTLSLLLPLKNLHDSGKHPSRYALRLILAELLFLPGIIVRIIGIDAWIENPVYSMIMSIGSGAAISFVYGLFFTFAAKNRAIWSTIAFSLGMVVYHIVMGPMREHPYTMTILFYGSGAIVIIAEVLLFIFSYRLPEKNITPHEDAKSEIHKKKFVIPAWLFALLAIIVVFWTNNFTSRLLLITNIHVTPGFNPSNIAMLLAVPVCGFIAERRQQLFMKVFVICFSALLIISPMLLLDDSQMFFMVFYTMNLVAVQLLGFVFLFAVVDNYWKGKGGRLAWVLPVSYYLIRSYFSIDIGRFHNIQVAYVYAVPLFSLAGILFYVLMRKFMRSQTTVMKKIGKERA